MARRKRRTSSRAATPSTGNGAGRRRSRRRLQGRRAHRRGVVLDPRADARVPRDARLRLRVGRRQAHRVGVDAGRARHARGLREGARRFRRPTSVSSPSTWAAASAASSRRMRRASSAPGWRKAAGAPVKLMLDRKEEHLAQRQPSVRLREDPRRRRRPTARSPRSTRRAGAPAAPAPAPDFPLPYIYGSRTAAGSHTDVYINAGQQRAMRAPGHPQGCFITEILMDELADRVRMDPVEFRIKNLPPASAERDVAIVLPDGRRAHSAGPSATPPAIRRRGRSSAAWAASANRWGGGGRGSTRPLRHHVRRRRRDALRHAGHRHRHADASSRWSPPRRWDCRSSAVKAEIGDSELSVQRRHRAAARRPPSVSPAIRITAGKALDALAAKVAPSARRRARSHRRPRRPRPRRRRSVEGPDVEGGVQAARHRADVGRRRVAGRPVGRRARAACSSPKSRSTSRPASRA